MADKSIFSQDEKGILVLALEGQITSLKRSKAKARTPQFAAVYESEIGVYEKLLSKLRAEV